MLTAQEKRLVCDALNGTILDGEYLDMMAGDEGALQEAAAIGTDAQGRVVLLGSTVCSGLELEVFDAIRLNGLDAKWDVDGAALLRKLRNLSVDQRRQLCRIIAEIWERNDAHFERDLDALEV